ncbi:hypothetical protein ASZ90_009547 [hydrocarbon metagenome]|uniref:Uncharacterized protein n=1 Tax=hydrocarbon metagenome TaxID=938273 RepID=A0A0W8FIJ0_9ZZZZ
MPRIAGSASLPGASAVRIAVTGSICCGTMVVSSSILHP